MKLLCSLLTIYFLSGLMPAQNLLLRNAKIYTFDRGVLAGYDLLMQNGKIARIDKAMANPGKINEIDLSGRHIIPGIIDSHTHIGMFGGTNESSENITPEVDMMLQINPDDTNIYYALSGGVTMVHTMHGSANPIGGQNVTLKLKWGGSAEEMLEKRALRTLKMALGENPKAGGNSPFFPTSRMGVASAIDSAFAAALEYKKHWEEYRRSEKQKGKALQLAPRRDLRLEALLDALSGKMVVRCHSYRAEESLEQIELSRKYGFKIQAFEHFHQAFRIADELKAAGIAVSVFTDGWNYKDEASEFTPYGFRLLYEKGVDISLNSDSGETMRRLFIEAGKMRRYAGMNDLDALKTITLNPARLLGMEAYTGSIAVGKDADLAVFDGYPLSAESKCLLTIVDGKVYFNREQDLKARETKPEVKGGKK